MNRFTLWETIRRDVFLALRMISKKPGFAVVAILTLGLAIGGNTAMFTIIHAVLLKPLPYPDSDKLVHISGGATPTRFAEMKNSAQSFTDLGANTGQESPTLSGVGEPEVLKGARVSASFLRILGVSPLRGRGFNNEEDSAGGAPVVMLSAELWQRKFGSDAEIIGKSVTIADTAYTVIGVLPPRFAFPFPDLDLWMTAPSEWPTIGPKSRALSPFLNIFGRLKPGVTLAQATAEAKVIHHQYALNHPTMLDAKPKKPATVTPLKDDLIRNVRSMLWMLLGSVGFVLLIACADVAALLLARAAARSREMAVRAAIGASPVRIVMQLTAESLVLAVLGGTLGVVLAAWSLQAIPKMTGFELPRAEEVHLDWTVLAFAAALSLATGLLFGLAPAFGAARPDLVSALRASGGTAAAGVPKKINMRGLLLIGQVALSIVLLIGTTLLIESVMRLRGVAIGFNPSNVLTASVSFTPPRYDTNQKRVRFLDDLVQHVDGAPGVRSAAAALFLPMMGYAGTPVQDAAKPLLKLNERPIATMGLITPGYFRTLEIPLRRGRDFNERDKQGAQRVAIIDEALARRFWPGYPGGQDPIGQHIWVGGIDPNPAEIVGIVSNIHQSLEASAWPETVYVSFAQNPQPFAVLAVRTVGNPFGSASVIREKVRALDSGQSISAVKTMDELVDEQVGQRRLLAMLLGGFATLALVLVLMGIYGIVAYSVAQRTQEMGIRRALGAGQGDILRLVVGQTFRLALTGAAVGVTAAYGLTRLMESLLFNVSATDPGTFAVVVVLFLSVALAASYIPARRAVRIDPIAALRV